MTKLCYFCKQIMNGRGPGLAPPTPKGGRRRGNPYRIALIRASTSESFAFALSIRHSASALV